MAISQDLECLEPALVEHFWLLLGSLPRLDLSAAHCFNTRSFFAEQPDDVIQLVTRNH